MDEGTRDGKGISETVNSENSVDSDNRGTTKNSNNLVETVNSENSVDSDNRGTTKNSNNLVKQDRSETIIPIRSDEEDTVRASGEISKAKVDMLGSSKLAGGDEKTKDLEAEKHSCVIDFKCGGEKFGEELEGESVCRICYLASDGSMETTNDTSTGTTTKDLIQLGCGCKDELGIAHSHCAEAWFKLKGNRQCEICGETAKNVKDVEDSRFIEEWNERISTGNNSSDRGRGCWRRQPFCNFLMACLVIAFVLPWFFRVNMF